MGGRTSGSHGIVTRWDTGIVVGATVVVKGRKWSARRNRAVRARTIWGRETIGGLRNLVRITLVLAQHWCTRVWAGHWSVGVWTGHWCTMRAGHGSILSVAMRTGHRSALWIRIGALHWSAMRISMRTGHGGGMRITMGGL